MIYFVQMIKKLLPLFLAFTLITGCSANSDDKMFNKRAERQAQNEAIVAIGSEPETGFDSTT